MSGVINGQSVSDSVSNAAWLAKNGDDTTVGRVTLAEIVSGASGTQVNNVQAEHNSIASFVGKALNTAYNALPGWASSIVGVSTDTLFARIQALVSKFLGTGGHAHTGVDGDGTKILGTSIASGAANAGQVLTANGSGAASFLDATGGGGGGSLKWVEDTNPPNPVVENHDQVYSFQSGLAQTLFARIKVPSSYVSGKPINLRIAFYSPDTSGTALIQTVSTLIRHGSDVVSSTTNQRTSVNGALTLTSFTASIPQSLVLDLSDSTGKINAVSVSADDYILIELTRGTDTATSDVKVPVYAAEVTFS